MALFYQCKKGNEFDLKVRISDNHFLKALINRGYDLNADSIISREEAAAVTFLNLNQANITDLSGIENFTNLETLWCYNNTIQIIDLSKNKALKILDCSYNPIRYINFDNPKLEEINCRDNQLTYLDLSKSTSMKKLNCRNNLLKALDVSQNTSLKEINCIENRLKVLDVSKCIYLEKIGL